MLKKEEAIPWPGTLAIVHSYIAYKTGKLSNLWFDFFLNDQNVFSTQLLNKNNKINNQIFDNPSNQISRTMWDYFFSESI